MNDDTMNSTFQMLGFHLPLARLSGCSGQAHTSLKKRPMILCPPPNAPLSYFIPSLPLIIYSLGIMGPPSAPFKTMRQFSQLPPRLYFAPEPDLFACNRSAHVSMETGVLISPSDGQVLYHREIPPPSAVRTLICHDI